MDPRIKTLRDAVARKKASALTVINAAEAEGRKMTAAERATVERAVAEVGDAKIELARLTDVDAKADRLHPTPGGSGLYAEFKAAGFPGSRASVPFASLKTASFDTGDLTAANPTRQEGPALGYDQRYLAPVFPSTAVDGSTTSVQVLRQKERTLPAAADVQRAIDATTAKAEVASVRELTQTAMKQLAVVESDIPNIVLMQDGVQSMIEVDLRLSYLDALDDLVADAIAASSPAIAGIEGTDFVEAIRWAIADMQGDGYTPSVLALSPGDHAALDLTRSEGDERFFVFGPGSPAGPPFGVRTVSSKSIADGSPYLLAPEAARRIYLGPVSLQTFEQDAGATNTSLVRMEGNALAVIERPTAIRIVSFGS